MKKSIVIIFLLIMVFSISPAQDLWIDQIKHDLATANHDTNRVLLMSELCNYYKFNKPDSALFYGYNALALARKLKFSKGEVVTIKVLALAEITLGNDLKALRLYLEASKIAEKSNLILDKASLIWGIGYYYLQAKEYEKAIGLFRESSVIFDSLQHVPFSVIALFSISEAYLASQQLDSALNYSQKAYKKSIHEEGSWATYYTLLSLGKVYSKMGNSNLALIYLRQSLSMAYDTEHFFSSNFSIAQLYKQIAKPDSSIFYANKSLEIAQESGFYKYIIDASLLLSSIYETTDIQQAYRYSNKAINFKDSLINLIKSTTQETYTDFDEKERQREIDEAKAEFQNRIRMNAFLGTTFTLLVIAIFLFWNSRLKQKAKRNIEKAYDRLKATQTQLIQAEKMASLGALTAGIAHEIQNPLNFVNNFSEVNIELIEEMKQELEKGNVDEAKSIAEDIAGNEKKITQHGKRADSIVKGMLLHSRSSSGIKEPTDINALADEFLRLTYHGLKAKDKSFNATMKNDFDPSIGKINVTSQEIGRVLMNLLNNAFYAVNEKRKLNSDGYEPMVTVSTRKLKDKVEIKVTDNGNGIPQALLDKVFQPFFTTKPSGEGTGLGLSLSYDIVTKGHGGELKVDTKEGEYTTFIIDLPI